MKKFLTICLFTLFACNFKANAAEHDYTYVKETDSLASIKILKWQNLKFGLLMHWGTYSQWGIVESWSICSEDEDWCRRSNKNYIAYKNDYEKLKTTFNPTKFNPEKWADAASKAGMKYVVFTTKHHDGFCMFDTKFTDYKITSKECPFSSNPKADITKEVFKSFKAQGFWLGAYFSKPDWHSADYWDPNFATPDRNPNYDIKKYPEKWKNFSDFTYNQIDELTGKYGPLDILWLDGGWVCVQTPSQMRELLSGDSYSFKNPQSQDINMPKIVANARKNSPGIIVVDRAVPGPHQNYLTPENQVPDAPLPFPWETCMTMATSWSYVPGDKYKPSGELIRLLVDVVSKGGNFLLNVGPGPDGDWDPIVYDRLNDIGDWMKINGEAIYDSKAVEPYKEGKVRFTQVGNNVYAIYTPDADETELPSKIFSTAFTPKANAKMQALGTSGKLNWEKVGKGFMVEIPEKIRKNPPTKFSLVIKIF